MGNKYYSNNDESKILGVIFSNSSHLNIVDTLTGHAQQDYLLEDKLKSDGNKLITKEEFFSKLLENHKFRIESLFSNPKGDARHLNAMISEIFYGTNISSIINGNKTIDPYNESSALFVLYNQKNIVKCFVAAFDLLKNETINDLVNKSGIQKQLNLNEQVWAIPIPEQAEGIIKKEYSHLPAYRLYANTIPIKLE